MVRAILDIPQPPGSGSTRRSSCLVVVALIVAGVLGAMAFWMWYGFDYSVRFRPEQLELLTTVKHGRGDEILLSVGFNNRSRRTIMVFASPDLRGPFQLRLTDLASSRIVPRSPINSLTSPGSPVVLRAGTQRLWSVRLRDLYEELSPGRYEIRVIYDTAGVDPSAATWIGEVDVGRCEGQPVCFTVAPTVRAREPVPLPSAQQ